MTSAIHDKANHFHRILRPAILSILHRKRKRLEAPPEDTRLGRVRELQRRIIGLGELPLAIHDCKGLRVGKKIPLQFT